MGSNAHEYVCSWRHGIWSHLGPWYSQGPVEKSPGHVNSPNSPHIGLPKITSLSLMSCMTSTHIGQYRYAFIQPIIAQRSQTSGNQAIRKWFQKCQRLRGPVFSSSHWRKNTGQKQKNEFSFLVSEHLKGVYFKGLRPNGFQIRLKKVRNIFSQKTKLLTGIANTDGRFILKSWQKLQVLATILSYMRWLWRCYGPINWVFFNTWEWWVLMSWALIMAKTKNVWIVFKQDNNQWIHTKIALRQIEYISRKVCF